MRDRIIQLEDSMHKTGKLRSSPFQIIQHLRSLLSRRINVKTREREKRNQSTRGAFLHTFPPCPAPVKTGWKKIHKLIIFSPVDVRLTQNQINFHPVRAIDWTPSWDLTLIWEPVRENRIFMSIYWYFLGVQQVGPPVSLLSSPG